MEYTNSQDFQKIFLSHDNLESIYQMLKGESKELRRTQIKKIMNSFDSQEFGDVNINSEPTKEENDDVISFEEFCLVFQNIFENAKNPNNVLIDGFALIDKNKKGYLEIEDVKKICLSLDQPMSESDLQNLLEYAGKNGNKITFESLMEFLSNEH